MIRTRCTLFLALPVLIALAGCSASNDHADAPQSESQVAAAAKSWDVALQNCMRDAGFDVDTPSEDGASADMSDDEADAFMAGFETCQKSTTTKLGERPTSAAEKKQLKEVETHTRKTVECLRDKGYDVSDPVQDLQGYFTVMEDVPDAPQDVLEQCDAVGGTDDVVIP